MTIENATRIVKTFPISRLITGNIYYTQETVNSGDYILYLVTDNFFIAAHACTLNNGALRLTKHLPGLHRCFAAHKESVKHLSVSDGFRVLTDFSANEESSLIHGAKSNHGYIEHTFSDEPHEYLLKIEPLQKILLASKATNKSFMFSIVTMYVGCGAEIDATVPGTVMDEDDMSKVDSFCDLLETMPDISTVEVRTSVFTIGEGETESIPEHLIEEIERYGTSDFISLDYVDETGEYCFTVDADNFR